MSLPAATFASVTTASGVVTDPLNLDPQVRQAYQRLYVLDYDGALSRFEKIESEHPQNPLAVDYVLNTLLFRELYRLDLLDTTFYAHDGFLVGKHLVAPDPDFQGRVNSLSKQVIDLADDELKADPKNADALFARGWARSLSSVFAGMVERSFISALHQALQARGDDEKVLELSPNYVDAKLIVGVHEYVVGSLPFGFKWVAGIAGISGSKSKGMDDLRDAGKRGIITSVEARTALALFLRREAKYPEAISVSKSLKDQYPQNFLFWLEIANLTKDSGDGPAAIAEYRALLDKARDGHYFASAHQELAWFGLADTLQGQADHAESAAAYEEAASQPAISVDLKMRCELDAGKMYDLLQQRDNAVAQYRNVVRDGGNSAPADMARKYLKSPYTGK